MSIYLIAQLRSFNVTPRCCRKYDATDLLYTFGFILSFANMMSPTTLNITSELDIFEDAKLLSLLTSSFGGKIVAHLRPQDLHSSLLGTAPNIYNPLEAYEIAFSGSSISLKIRESSATLGHRRIIMPTETVFVVSVIESIVDMAFEGKTECELSWDFQGSSPILQVTSVGHSPANASHENRDQVAVLISDLRQGRLNFRVSDVGGISFKQAATSRAHREGLYDWKFFNALVSPDEESPDRIFLVLHDKRTMRKLLQVIKLINSDLEEILRYILIQGKLVAFAIFSFLYCAKHSGLTDKLYVSAPSLLMYLSLERKGDF